MNADVSHVSEAIGPAGYPDQAGTPVRGRDAGHAGPAGDAGSVLDTGDAGWVAGRRPTGPPRRLVAAIEALVAAGLVVLAVWAWRHATIAVRLPESDNPAIPDFTSRLSGPWVAAAFMAATVAGLLVLDALRQTLAARRARAAWPAARMRR